MKKNSIQIAMASGAAALALSACDQPRTVAKAKPASEPVETTEIIGKIDGAEARALMDCQNQVASHGKAVKLPQDMTFLNEAFVPKAVVISNQTRVDGHLIQNDVILSASTNEGVLSKTYHNGQVWTAQTIYFDMGTGKIIQVRQLDESIEDGKAQRQVYSHKTHYNDPLTFDDSVVLKREDIKGLEACSKAFMTKALMQ